ncbi:MAG: GIY-YIG nuclease family protein [Chloroflexota bacterium]
MDTITNQPGTYILILALVNPIANLQIGRRLTVDFDAGFYAYVGSALGAGGLASRLRRHMKSATVMTTRKHWHIDYLLPHAQRTGALIRAEDTRLECAWASWVEDMAEECIIGFGASDCQCSGHLFYIGASLDEPQFIKQATDQLQTTFITH